MIVEVTYKDIWPEWQKDAEIQPLSHCSSYPSRPRTVSAQRGHKGAMWATGGPLGEHDWW